MAGLLRELAGSVLPVPCAACGVVVRGDADVHVPVCRRCRPGLASAPPAPPPFPLAGWAAAFAYEGAIREVVAALKYRNHRYALGWLAEHIAHAASGLHARFDVVTNVPTTAARRRRRGFDHGELLARRVASLMDLPYRRALRRLGSATQTGASAPDRRRGPDLAALHTNVAGAGHAWLIIDDVATTGGSLAAAARVLQSRGVRDCWASVAARTPARGSAGATSIIQPHGSSAG